jgi:hypothetical protein
MSEKSKIDQICKLLNSAGMDTLEDLSDADLIDSLNEFLENLTPISPSKSSDQSELAYNARLAKFYY